jgi:hypothetical protein
MHTRSLPTRFWALPVIALVLLALAASRFVSAQGTPTPTATATATATADFSTLPEPAQTALADFLEDRAEGDPRPAAALPTVTPRPDAAAPRAGGVGRVLFLPLLVRSVPPPAPEPPTATPTPTEEPGEPAEVWVTLRKEPSIRVDRDDTLEYEIFVRNRGDGPADEVRVTLPYDSDQLTFLDADFEDADDFVEELNEDEVVLVFEDVEGVDANVDEDPRRATIFWDVNDLLPIDTVISIRGTVAWDDARDGGDRRTNRAPVLVGEMSNDSEYVFAEVTPELGQVGTEFAFLSDRFIPDEEVAAWFNTPDGVRALERDLEANDQGVVEFTFSSDGFAPARYEIVVFGLRSKLTAVTEFFVDPNP